MSRVGKMPITIPSGVNITTEGDDVVVTGSKGTLNQAKLPGISFKQEGEQRAKHGLMRALVNNMVTGVSAGFSRKLEVNGVGYRVAVAGSNLNLNLGFSHTITYKIPEGITIAVEQNNITVSGIDKQQVGQVAAEIRAFKKPEPYKGKGIKYDDERILRKSGKSGKEK
jgi:large subunit ribosomal protein L6